jgi:hypothetical protein
LYKKKRDPGQRDPRHLVRRMKTEHEPQTPKGVRFAACRSDLAASSLVLRTCRSRRNRCFKHCDHTLATCNDRQASWPRRVSCHATNAMRQHQQVGADRHRSIVGHRNERRPGCVKTSALPSVLVFLCTTRTLRSETTSIMAGRCLIGNADHCDKRTTTEQPNPGRAARAGDHHRCMYCMLQAAARIRSALQCKWYSKAIYSVLCNRELPPAL